MNILFFTKPKQSTLRCLRFLVDEGDVVTVVLFHKEEQKKTDFFAYCKENDVEIIDFDQVDDYLQANRAIQIVYSNTFPKKIKGAWIDAASIAAVNFHAAPLPEYRGVFGYNFAILNGDDSYGVSAHYLDEEFDTGNIIKMKRFPYRCNEGSVRELVSLTEENLCELFKETHMRFKNGEAVEGEPQRGGGYYSRKDFDKAKQIKTEDSADEIRRKIRAFWYPPYEGAYIKLGGQKFCLMPSELDGDLLEGSTS